MKKNINLNNLIGIPKIYIDKLEKHNVDLFFYSPTKIHPPFTTKFKTSQSMVNYFNHPLKKSMFNSPH